VVGEDLHGGPGLRLLLDTHVVHWALAEPASLSDRAKATVIDPDNEVFVSPLSVYEWVFKAAIGKLRAPADIVGALTRAGFGALPLTPQQVYVAGSLPLHHRDPFDRMLVAQAQLEGMTILTNDREIPKYQVATLPA
jgi:PIN domain nuclease of toxin-antitoxin system